MDMWLDYLRRGRKYAEYMGWKFLLYDAPAPHQQGEGKTMATQTSNAMNYTQAREAFTRLKEAGFLGTIRQRSWDTEGLYFAVEVQEGGTLEKLYRTADVDDFLAKRAPLDTEPYSVTSLRPFGKASALGSTDTRFFRFRTPGGVFLMAPDGAVYWSTADIQRAGGVATDSNGRRYRLGERRFVPFVETPAK